MKFRVGLALVLGLAAAGSALAQDHPDGEALSQACTSCHGLNGVSAGAIPTIAALPADDIVAKLVAFREQTADATIMNRIARGYTDDEIAALADYFSQLSAP